MRTNAEATLARTFAQVAANGSRRHLRCRQNAPTAVGGYNLLANRAGREISGPGRRAVVAIALCLGALHGLAEVQPPNPDLVSARSQSGQFVVFAWRSAPPPLSVASLAANPAFVQLEPTLATVSCERIKQVLTRELGATEPWRGHIYVVLYPARGAGDPITITSERFKDGWQYRVDFPDMVDRTRYVRGVVQVLLLELANRNAQTRAAELPLWLIEGFSQLLLASSEAEIILPPPRNKANGLNLSTLHVNARKEGLLERAQKKLRGRPPLTFEALSWPSPDELSGDTDDLYSGSAEFFLGELLRLPDGRGCLRAMLAQLPQTYNWQFAFLRGFHACFERPLDVEKWWALSLIRTSGRDLSQPWSLEESWQKLDQTVHLAVQVRTGTNELPLHADLKLQTIIREWDSVRQTPALASALRELGLLRLRIAQGFLELVQEYCQTLETYLQQRDHPGSVLPFTRKAGRRRAVEAAVQHLDALDARREALRPLPRPAATNQPPALPAPAR
jgi:hypothetical protein